MSAALKLKGGIVCAVVTPFTTAGAPDVDALTTLIDFQIECGVDGIFVLGTTGEGLLCSVSERQRLTERCLQRAADRVPVVVHCGATDTGTAVELVRHAAVAGATSVAATAPIFFAYPEAAIYEHFARLAAAAPDVEHYVYDNPERVGFSVGVPLVTRIVERLAPFVGVKDTGDSLGKITEYFVRGDAGPQVYTGNNVIILPALLMGARGGVSALANAVPELFVALHRAFRNGRLDVARELQLTVARLQAAIAGVPYVAAVKHLVTRRGLPGGAPRSPLPDLTTEQARSIDDRLAAEPVLEPWLEPVS